MFPDRLRPLFEFAAESSPCRSSMPQDYRGIKATTTVKWRGDVVDAAAAKALAHGRSYNSPVGPESVLR